MRKLNVKGEMRNIYGISVCILLLAMFVSCKEDTDSPDVPPPAASASISGTLPVLYIETENRKPIESKEEYLNAVYRLDPMDAEDIEPLGTEAEPLPMQIRGRGHSSWKSPKKPYNPRKTQWQGCISENWQAWHGLRIFVRWRWC